MKKFDELNHNRFFIICESFVVYQEGATSINKDIDKCKLLRKISDNEYIEVNLGDTSSFWSDYENSKEQRKKIDYNTNVIEVDIKGRYDW